MFLFCSYAHKDTYVKFKQNKNFSLIKKDICDLSVQIEAIKNIDCVVFLAEIVGDPSCAAKPEDALKTNYLAVSSMANLCSHMNINRFIYTSSCSVYGSNVSSHDLLKEDSVLNPISHYGVSKLCGELYLKQYENYGIDYTIFRLFSCYGPNQNLNNMKQGMVSIYLRQFIDNNFEAENYLLKKYSNTPFNSRFNADANRAGVIIVWDDNYEKCNFTCSIYTV